MRKIIYLGGASTGNAISGIGNSLRHAYESNGYVFDLIEIDRPDAGMNILRAIDKSDVAFALGFMASGAAASANLTDDANQVRFNVWERFNIPFISVYGDSPAYFFDRHVSKSPIFASVYAFPDHLLLRKNLPLAHGALGTIPQMCHNQQPFEALDFAKKRDGKIYFLKNGNDPEQMPRIWRETLPAAVANVLLEVGDHLVSVIDQVHGTLIDDLVQHHFGERGIDIGELVRLRLFCIGQLDDYVRRVKSTMMAKALSDFPVVIQGHNWEHLDFSGRRCTFNAGGDYSASQSQFQDSLAMIDMSPNTTYALHERVRRSFGSYTLCLTNEQHWLDQNLPELSKHFTFRFNVESIQARVADVLSRPQEHIDLGIETARAFRADNTQEDYVNYMAGLADTVRIASGKASVTVPPYHVWPPQTV